MRRRILIGLAVLLVLVLGASFGLAWWGSSEAIEPDHQYYTNPDHSNVVREVRVAGTARTVVIGSPNGLARRLGTHRMVWDGVDATVGPVLAETADTVERPIVEGPAPSVGTTVSVTGVMITDPKSTFGFDYTEVPIQTELGPAPAWRIPATGPNDSTWVIAIHGRNARRNAMVAIPAFHRLGLPVLAITYRNDEGAPPSPDGLMHYGESEYRDVEAAVRYAQSQGARRVVLYGGSMGGMIVGQFLRHSELASTVTATVLDSPLLSMPVVAEHAAGQYGAPPPAAWLSTVIIDWRSGVDMAELDLATHPPATRPPMLLFGAGADSQAPPSMYHDFVAAAPGLNWPVTYEEFAGAEHVESWNADPPRYERAISDFVSRTVLGRR